jgi:hypothetical protein
MTQWWTYSFEDVLLFSPRVYWRLIQLHNESVWPLHVLALLVGVAILLGVVRPQAWTGRAIAVALAAAWMWVAWSFLWTRYATINWPMAYVAPVFALQALLLLWTGVVRGRLDVSATMSGPGTIGLGLLAYALALHPLMALLAGRPVQAAEVFAIMPDPTVVATLGILAMAVRAQWLLIIVPVAWCMVSWGTLTALASPGGWILLATAALAVAALTGTALEAHPKKH